MQSAYSSSKLFPGYYIEKNGDSIQCQIEFGDWNLNPSAIHVLINNEVRIFGPGDINGFGIPGYADYRSALVTYHTSPVSGENIPEKFSDSTETKIYFLKILTNGAYRLYNLLTTERSHYFMSYKEGPVTELVYRVTLNVETLDEDAAYKKQIFSLFNTEGITEIYFNQINKAGYNSSDLLRLFRALNESHSGTKYIKKSGGAFDVDIFSGVIKNSFPTDFTFEFGGGQLDPSYSYSGGLNFLYTIPGKFESFKIGLSIGYNHYNSNKYTAGTAAFHESNAYYDTTQYREWVKVSNAVISPGLYFMYTVNPLGKSKLFLKAGLNYNFVIGNNSNVVSVDTTFSVGARNGIVSSGAGADKKTLIIIREGYISTFFALGIMMGRHKFEFMYSPPAQLAQTSEDILQPTGQNFKLSSIGLNYYFSLFSSKKWSKGK